MIVSSVKFWFSPSALLVSRVTKFDDDMVVASEEFEGGRVGTFFLALGKYGWNQRGRHLKAIKWRQILRPKSSFREKYDQSINPAITLLMCESSST